MTYENLAPNYQLLINGSQDITDQITPYANSVMVEMSRDMADQLTLKLDSPLEAREGYFGPVWADSKLLVEGTLVEVWMGYGNLMEFIGGYYLLGQLQKFPSSGLPLIETLGLDASNLLMTERTEGKKKRQNFPGMSDSDIVNAVIESGGYKMILDIESTKGAHDRFQKQGMSDYEFIHELAKINGYDFWVAREELGYEWREDVLHFIKRTGGAQAELYEFEYLKDGDGTLLEFDPQRSTLSQISELEVIWYDTQQKRVIKTRVTIADIFPSKGTSKGKQTSEAKVTTEFAGTPTEIVENEIANGSEVRLKSFGRDAVKVKADRAFKDEADIRKWAEEFFKESAYSYIIGRGRLIGLETLRPGQSHILKGLGNQLSGKYYFTNVSHVMDGGDLYFCDFTAFKVIE